MLRTTNQLSYEFKRLIREEYERLRDNLASGSAQNWDQYQKMVGTIHGLALSLEFLEDAKAVADGEKPQRETV
jgi:hypothetical protein